MHKRGFVAALVATVSLGTGTAIPAQAQEAWGSRIERLIGRRSMGVAVHEEGRMLFVHRQIARRVPASNQKLLVSMALLDRLGPDHLIRTSALTSPDTLQAGLLIGDLWLRGEGDPTIAANASYGKDLPFTPTRLAVLTHAIKAAGVRHIEGRVMGEVDFFDHDWFAPGWKSSFPMYEVSLPSALTVNGNIANGHRIADPERRAAVALTKRLEDIGVTVTGRPGAAAPPPGLTEIAALDSPPLNVLLGYMNRQSNNFFAEMLGKLLGANALGPLGTIDKGASTIASWAETHGADVVAYDSSGLSGANRISPRDLVRLLAYAEDQPWGLVFRSELPAGGQGTLEDRLTGVQIRAKTGTLQGVSALSGWVRLELTGEWAEFSILSHGLPKYRAVAIENRIVRIIARNAA